FYVDGNRTMMDLSQRNHIVYFIAICCCAGWLFQGCTQRVVVTEQPETSYYASDPGSDLVRKQVNEAFRSVIKLQNTVVYRTYLFPVDRLPTQREAETGNLRELAAEMIFDDHSTSGTAIVLHNRDGKTGALTASHIVSFPDTIWNYHRTHRRGGQRLVEGVSIKHSESHYVIDTRGVAGFTVAANDERRDLALIVHDWGDDERGPAVTTLRIRPGERGRLDWMDRIYALGYPKGFQMVTRAMVSDFSSSPRRSFVLDASFNRGFSGGPLFAVRADGTGLEWVGIISAAHAESEYFLAPDQSAVDDLLVDELYEGPVVMRRENRINYGITFAVGMDDIVSFFRENASTLRSHDMMLPTIF
ncbi:MAG: S1 family peptidase, partial [Balneolaceae bacterium]